MLYHDSKAKAELIDHQFMSVLNNLLNCGIKTKQCISILNVSVSHQTPGHIALMRLS